MGRPSHGFPSPPSSDSSPLEPLRVLPGIHLQLAGQARAFRNLYKQWTGKLSSALQYTLKSEQAASGEVRSENHCRHMLSWSAVLLQACRVDKQIGHPCPFCLAPWFVSLLQPRRVAKQIGHPCPFCLTSIVLGARVLYINFAIATKHTNIEREKRERTRRGEINIRTYISESLKLSKL